MNTLVLAGLLSCLSAWAAATSVADTLYLADGVTLFNGTLDIRWSTFQGSDGKAIPSGHLTPVITNGVLSVSLEPTDLSSPRTFYTVRYALTNGLPLQEFWSVPTSATPVTLSMVRSISPPAGGTLIALSQLSTSGCTNGQVIAFNGASFVCSASGSGTVTHTPGALTLNQIVFGNGTGDIKVGNLTGDVITAGGTATSIQSGVVTNGMLAGSISASKLVGTDITAIGTVAIGTWNATPIVASKLVGTDIATVGTVTTGTWQGSPIALGSYVTGILPCADHPILTGDATTPSGSCAVTVGRINGIALSVLATGILKNTTGTGAPSIAVAGDFPTLNQNTSGSAGTLSGTIVLANTALTTRGDLLTVNASPALARLAKGTQYQTLHGGASDLLWDAVHLDQTSAITGVLPNANTTAASTNTASTIVLRDGSGNFAAAAISATSFTASAGVTGAAQFFTVVSKNSNYTATATDYTILVDTTGGNVGITLPASPTAGQIFNIKKIAAANTLTILGNGNNIDGAASVAVTTNYQNTKLQFFSGAWYTL